jgi:hypothetical protein
VVSIAIKLVTPTLQAAITTPSLARIDAADGVGHCSLVASVVTVESIS